MISQFNDFSSWREDKITIEGGEVYRLYFEDTVPNMFLVQNPNGVILKVSIGGIPTTDNYEFLIGTNSSETIGRPKGSRYLYLLNDNSENAIVTVYSIKDTFDINILKNTTVSMDNATVNVDGIVKGFKAGVSIPSGNNDIGNVGVTDASAARLKTAISQLMTSGGSDIGTGMETLKTLVSGNLPTIKEKTTNINTLLNQKLNSDLSSIKTAIENTNTIVAGEGNAVRKIISYANNLTSITFGASTYKKINDCGIYMLLSTLLADIEWMVTTNLKGQPEPTPIQSIGTKIHVDSYKISGDNVILSCRYERRGDYMPRFGTVTVPCYRAFYKHYGGETDYYIKIEDFFTNELFVSHPQEPVEYYMRPSNGKNMTLTGISPVEIYEGNSKHVNNFQPGAPSSVSDIGADSTLTFSSSNDDGSMLKICNYIHSIRTSFPACTVKIYTSESDYFTTLITGSSPVTDLDIDVFGIVITNTTTTEGKISIIGGWK